MILIDNIKLKYLRRSFNFKKISMFEQYHYIVICSNLERVSNLKQLLLQYPTIKIQFFKKSKRNIYLIFLLPYLTNSLILLGCNELNVFFKLCECVSKNILFIKVQNTIYSINQFMDCSSNQIMFGQTLNSLYYNLIKVFYSFSLLHK